MAKAASKTATSGATSGTTSIRDALKGANEETATAPPSLPPKRVLLGVFNGAELYKDASVPIPADIVPGKRSAPPRDPSRDLPFKAIWATMGHNDHVYIPRSFWEARAALVVPGKNKDGTQRQVAPCDIPTTRGKLHNAFNAWKKEEGHKEKRANRQLILRPRKPGEQRPENEGGQFTEEGLSMWMQIVETPSAALAT